MIVSVTMHSEAHKKEENPTDQSLVLSPLAILISQDEPTWNRVLFSIPANIVFSTRVFRPCFSFLKSHPSYMVKTFISRFFIFLWYSSYIFSYIPSISSKKHRDFSSPFRLAICFTAYSSSQLILSHSRCITFYTLPTLNIFVLNYLSKTNFSCLQQMISISSYFLNSRF